MNRLAIVNGCVITMNTGREVFEPGVVLIEGSRIAAVGPATADLPKGCEVIDATGCVVMPGLVNAHTHLYSTFGRSLSFEQGFTDWLRTQKALIAQFTPEDFALCVELGLILNLRSGNTCVLDNLALPAASGNRLYRAALATAARYHLGYILARGYTDQFNSPDYIEDLPTIEGRMTGLIDEFHGAGDGRLTIMMSPMLPWALSPEGYRLTRRLADRHRLGIHMHTAESAGYADLIERAYGHRSNIRVYADGGCLGPDVQLLGCAHLDTVEFNEIARSGTRVVLDPISGMSLGLGFAPTLQVIGNGHPTALATNGMASAGGQDLFEAMKTVVGLARLQAGTPQAISAQRALEMATIEGARALGLDDELGSIQPGKRADVICVEIATPYCAPALDLASTVVFSCTSRDVRDVVANGRVAVRDHRLMLADEAAIVDRVTANARAALARAQRLAPTGQPA